ncbi:MAG: hypothetical protein OJF49_001762 [Ktedonobacterales bacterium]|nr:MAG: hypothetical protein OJF49_001762 [Ktedonobacterales bacterium]
MNAPTTPPRAAAQPVDRGKAGGTLRGVWLFVARAAWLAVAALTIGSFAFATPLRYAQLAAACSMAGCATGGLLTSARFAALFVVLEAVSALVWILVALVIFLRRSADPMALFCALALLTFGGARFPDVPVALTGAYPTWWLPVEALRFFGSACLSMFCYTFPDGRFVPRWTLPAALLWIAAQVPEFFAPTTSVSADELPGWLRLAGFGGFVLSVAVAQVYRYRRVSSPRQRQQTKWVVFGLASALTGYLVVAFVLPLFVPTLGHPTLLTSLVLTGATAVAMLIVPLTLGIAILRQHLFDIDRIINLALVYGTLTVALATGYFAGVIALQTLVTPVLGADSPVAVVVTTLLIAALIQPLRRRIQTIIDQRFYRGKYDAAKMLAAFEETLKNEVDLATLQDRLLAVVAETMHPVSLSLWLAPQAQSDGASTPTLRDDLAEEA